LTTIRLDARLLAEAKKLAAETNRTLSGVIEDALHEVLGRRSARQTISLTIVGGRGVNPGIDLDDSAALMAAKENRDDSA